MFTIYTITVGDKLYVGATKNYLSRSRTHRAALNRIIRVGKLELRTISYKMFNPKELAEIGYTIYIYCTCLTTEEAIVKEQELLDFYHQAGLCLNTSFKSGLPVNEKKKSKKVRPSKYRRF